jgi:hypothetical protein
VKVEVSLFSRCMRMLVHVMETLWGSRVSPVRHVPSLMWEA